MWLSSECDSLVWVRETEFPNDGTSMTDDEVGFFSRGMVGVDVIRQRNDR